MWDIRGWKHLAINNDPPLIAAREEFLCWLGEVPEPNQTIWRQRLLSNQDHPHFSVRLELYLHHHFKSNRWNVQIEPEMPDSSNKPDFKVSLDGTDILVEAKALLDDQITGQQAQRLRQLADSLSSKLAKTVIIQPLSNLPSSLPARKISNEIQQHLPIKASEVLEFQIDGKHQNTPFSLNIVVLPEATAEHKAAGVQGMISGVQTLTTGARIRDALEEKAGKYGNIDIPFLIAVYGAGQFPITNHIYVYCDAGYTYLTKLKNSSPSGDDGILPPAPSLSIIDGASNKLLCTTTGFLYLLAGGNIPSLYWLECEGNVANSGNADVGPGLDQKFYFGTREDISTVYNSIPHVSTQSLSIGSGVSRINVNSSPGVYPNPIPTAANTITNRIYRAEPDKDSISVSDSSGTIIKSIKVGSHPTAIAVNPKINRIYVANRNDNTVSVINGDTNELVANIKVGNEPDDIAANPNTNRIYIANWADSSVTILEEPSTR